MEFWYMVVELYIVLTNGLFKTVYKVLFFSTPGRFEFTYRPYRIQLENMSILVEWLVLYPLRCYFSVAFTQLKGRNQKFNLYPLGVIF